MEFVQIVLILLNGVGFTLSRACDHKQDEATALLRKKTSDDMTKYFDNDDLILTEYDDGDVTAADKDAFKSFIPADAFDRVILMPQRDEEVAVKVKDGAAKRKSKTAKKDSVRGKGAIRNAPSEQGIWAWRGKKETDAGSINAKRRNYFTRKMINWMNFNRANLARKNGAAEASKSRYGKRVADDVMDTRSNDEEIMALNNNDDVMLNDDVMVGV